MDDFAGLAWSDAVIKPKSQPQTLGSGLSKPSPVISAKPYDAFASIAASGSSRASHAGSDSNISGRSGRSTPASRPSVSSNLASNPQDAFSGLLSLGVTSNSNVSIAERQAQAERERIEKEARKAEELRSQSDFWDRYDSKANPLPTTSGVAGSSSSQAGLPSLSFPPIILTPLSRPSSAVPSSSSHTSAPASSNNVNDAWGDFDLLSLTNAPAPIHPPTLVPPVAAVSTQDPFDFSEFGSPLAQHTPSLSSRSRSRTGDYDFGHEGFGGLLGDGDSGDEDLLGGFGRPVESRPQPASQSVDGSARTGGASPPPHVVGQIVEMGFTPQEARIALAATGSGVDVQMALESLLNEPQSSAQRPGRPSPPRRRTSAEEEVASYEQRERERERGHRQPVSDGGLERSSSPHELEERHQNGGSGLNTTQLREQADRYLTQASEIGLSVFNKANAFLSQGKAQLQKAYEERRAATITSDPRSKVSGRPHWAAGASISTPEQAVDVSSGFRDDDSEDETPQDASHRGPTLLQRSQSPCPEPQAMPPPEAELFSDEPGTTYVSPNRRRPNRDVIPSKLSSLGTCTSSSAPRPLSPPRLRKRDLVSARLSVIADAKVYRSKGTEMFKLGRFAEAEMSYTSAIALVPSGHLYLVPLHNNRAAARLKTGDSKGAVADCTTVLQIIGENFHPAKDEPAPPFDDGEVLNLGDALVKALHKRAEAYESEEKWNQAKHDWEKLIGVDWPAGQRVRQEALRGVARSRKMLTADHGPSGEQFTPSTLNPRRAAPRPRSQNSNNVEPPSEASTRLRAANQVAEAEEAERERLKDTIDSRLGAWKGGKESNLRALIASLDTVLWPELGWQKVGMHELVSPAQVKMRYMKAIARVHPDKLSMNTTVEHRMIANGVFGTLNEAWVVFKP